MDGRSGVYILSHQPLDESKESGVTNPGFTDDEKLKGGADGERQPEVHFKDSAYIQSDKPYRGMGKDELLSHSSKGVWKTMRYICMTLVFLVWLGLIITVIALIVVYPRCRKPDPRLWWQQSTTYRVYVRSFTDSDDDGIGDINGVARKLNYLKSIGVGAISLSPIFKQAPGKDSDYDIIDHKDINPEYGTMENFKSLVNATHALNMYLIMDFVPGFTSEEHPWFIQSQESNLRNNTKRKFYVWEDGSPTVPPNNWKSMYNGSAWEYQGPRNQCYLHQREKEQPDLNLRSQAVMMELQDVLKFWLDLGVDGFYIRESGTLLEDYDMRDEPRSNANITDDQEAYDYYDHTYTYGLKENVDLFAKWRYYLDVYGNKTGSYKLLYSDVMGDVPTNMDYYGLYNRDGVDYPLNRQFQALNKMTSPSAIFNTVKNWLDGIPPGRWSNWMGGDENVNRFAASREGLNRPMLMLTLLLPGTPFVYYGDEIGMTNTEIQPPNAWVKGQPMRSPMQWDNSTTGGFCQSCSPWLPFSNDLMNVTVEKQELDANSMLSLFKNLTSLRQKPSFRHGDFRMFPLGGSVVSFIREFDGETGYLVAVNVGESKTTRDLSGLHGTLPGSTTVVLTTKNGGQYSEEDSLSTSSITLAPYEGVVSSWKYVAKEL